ncbi:OB-fold domain-containing protein [Actinomadura kijaniata]|uniref:DUF35 domain-containing protein n=1 Tax=Actinomadura namibiensis TaxID=182080 RepID=A0A7W3QS73_ACTNM|nr:OB-fold domain-containing protein [Actinomadura namibiensis]MBA8957342.1 hypothetical protein [Actinomadura namibiensis]
MTAPAFPLPDPGEPLTGGFWRAAARDRLAFPLCGACDRFCWYPEPGCPGCGGSDLVWTSVEPAGTLFSWSVVHHAFLPAFADQVPFVAAVVTIDGAPGVRLVTRLIDARPCDLAVGARVRARFVPLRFSTVAGEVRAPFFRPDPRRIP